MLTTLLADFFDQNSLRSRKRWTFSLESGRGETYRNENPTLYAHSEYERSSVLAGRPQRVFVAQWKDEQSARSDIAEAKKTFKKFRVDDMLSGGTTHIPVDQLVSHLPDDTDY
jgi:hypothetical protein